VEHAGIDSGIFNITLLIESLSDSFRSAQESRMDWKKRQKQIQYLQAKHGSDRSLAKRISGPKGRAADSAMLERHAG
jgi:hypothetical protein